METNYGLALSQFIDLALAEDVGDGDQTTLATIPDDLNGSAIMKAKEDGVICGLVVADQIFNSVDPRLIVKTLVADGTTVVRGDSILEVDGPVASILKAERLVLNCMQRMSGIATKTRSLVKLIEGTGTRLLDTRKTTPLFRSFEKWAVLAGGGVNHRFGLYDMILIKDNHVDASGGIVPAIQSTKRYLEKSGKKLKIEIETRSIEEVRLVLQTGGVDRIMLDNFSIDKLKEAVKVIDKKYETEASGNIDEKTIREVALTGVDFISAGALTHSFKSLDISLKIITRK